MPDVPSIRRALAQHRAETESTASSRAAVAMILREDAAGQTEALFIERAQHPGDPWSGHMAFPGGRMDEGDADLLAAAARETREEVGLELEQAEVLGHLADLQGRNAGRRTGLVVSGFVYHHASPGPLRLNHEVACALWVPLRALVDPAQHVDYRVPSAPELRFPGLRVGEAEPHVVWGLTYRFVEEFLRIVGQPLPDRWQDFRE